MKMIFVIFIIGIIIGLTVVFIDGTLCNIERDVAGISESVDTDFKKFEILRNKKILKN